MNVPSLIPNQEPWSPVGYQVVEVAEKERGLTPSAGKEGSALPPLPPPSSPIGYRIVQVADEKPLEPAPTAERQELNSSRSFPSIRRSRGRRRVASPYGLGLWVSLAVGGLFLVVLSIAGVHVASNLPPRGQFAGAEVKLPDAPVAAVAEPAVVVPVAAPVAADPAKVERPAKIEMPALPGVGCLAGDKEGEDRETFGTQVAFARNPLEAARVARNENKLTFLLHVSGDFEDAGFT